MECLENGINFWEDALASYRGDSDSLRLTNEEEAEFAKEIQELLDVAYDLQQKCQLLFLDQVKDFFFYYIYLIFDSGLVLFVI